MKEERGWRVICGDCMEELPRLGAASVEAVITDPPYGIGFEGLRWDRHDPDRYDAWCERWLTECLRVLRPGGHLASFAAPRTAHRLATGIEKSGFELRDTLMWVFSRGYPKSRNLRGQWAGWGTGLRPAYEPILLARRPFDGKTARNVEAHGTGALHLAACRVPGGEGQPDRWPSNLIFGHGPDCAPGRCEPRCAVRLLDAQRRRAGAPPSRFFYCVKASRRERDAGCERLPRRTVETLAVGAGAKARRARRFNPHATVKPLELMHWLVRLLTPPGGLVLDPFCGSGSTGCAAALEGRFIGIEREPAYAEVARARIAFWQRQAGGPAKGCGGRT